MCKTLKNLDLKPEYQKTSLRVTQKKLGRFLNNSKLPMIPKDKIEDH